MNNTYPEPKWCTPQDVNEGCSSLVATGPSPMVLTGVFIRLIQYHFSDPNNIQNENLKGYIWTNSPNGCISNDDPSAEEGSGSGASGSSDSGGMGQDDCPVPDTHIDGSKMLVTVSYKRDGANVQQRPAIYIKREPVVGSRISFQNKAQASLNKDGILEGTNYQMTISGKHSIIAVGKTGAEADALGEEIYFRMLQYMPIIRDDVRLGHFLPESISEVKEIPKEASKAFYTVVSLTWAYVYRWRVIPESPTLKRLALLYTDY
jgi:hypothetical protein